MGNNNVYTIEYKTNKMTEIYNINENGYYYKFFDNYNKLIIVLQSNIILFNNEIIYDITHIFDTNKYIFNITENNNNYYFLTNNYIFILNEKFEFSKYQLENPIIKSYFYNDYEIIFFYNNELYYAYFNNNNNNIISLNLVKVDLENNIFDHKIIFQKILSNVDIVSNLCNYNNYILFGINNNNNTELFQYNLINNIFKKNTINIISNKIFMQKNNLFIYYNSRAKTNKFVFINIDTLKIQDYINFNYEPQNGFFNIFMYYNKIYIDEYIFKSNDNLLIYEVNTSEKNIKFNALVIKHILKNQLNIDFGCYRDIKEYILEKMNCKVELNENDEVVKYKITDPNYHIICKLSI